MYFAAVKMSDARQLQFAGKRCIDLVVSIGALLILFPFFIVIAIAIKANSGGPILFRQQRWGANGKIIEVYKFRSLRLDQNELATSNGTDLRVTRIGAWLRKSSVDELPQLINVLKGDMSLVGPRCHAVGMLAGGKPYEQVVSNYHARHAVRPGITGLAQVRGLRGPTVFTAKARQRIVSDLYYIENYSLRLDLRILVGTVRNELFGGMGF
ncbi:sugar transferase [Rhizobium sp. TH2]|nr:sugar transferase [Rhizobium sp. TH2]